MRRFERIAFPGIAFEQVVPLAKDVEPRVTLEGIRFGGTQYSVLAIGARREVWSRGATSVFVDGAHEQTSSMSGVELLAESLDPVEDTSVGAQLLSGWFGYIAYDAARRFLPLQEGRPPTSDVRDLSFFAPELVVTANQKTGVTVYHLADASGPALELLGRLEAREGIDLYEQYVSPSVLSARLVPTLGDFCSAVERAKQHLLDGEIYQVVLSVEHAVPCMQAPEWILARLRRLSPSRLIYGLVFPGLALVGSSPEPFLLREDDKISMRVLAGTRRRTGDRAQDERRKRQLEECEKETAEHRMLVDLARNDLGRIAVTGSVRVPAILEVEEYRNVMHLASLVEATLPRDVSVDSIIRSTFPAGTMTGTPKLRAMQLIDELEVSRRGAYSGAVGFVSARSMQLYLTIRGLRLENEVAYSRAGAGIVYDSDAKSEYRECLSKLTGILAAMGLSPGAVAN